MLKEEKIGARLRKIEKVEDLSSYALTKVDPSLLLNGYSNASPASRRRQRPYRTPAKIHL